MGTIAAVVVALLYGRADAQHRAATMERLEEERDDARKDAVDARELEAARSRAEQARLVGVWVEVGMRVTRYDDMSGIPVDGVPLNRMVVRNFSPFPIFDADLSYRYGDGRRYRPASGIGRLDTSEVFEHADAPGIVADQSYATFRDLSGLRWRRYMDGTLVAGDPVSDTPEIPYRDSIA